MRGMKKKSYSGIASFYIVAFSTLILTVMAMSFAAVIISEITRTENDELAQSAYDSALAGIEDAKLAYYNYLSCLESGDDYSSVEEPDVSWGTVSCKDIVYWMRNPDCYMVGRILGRIGKGDTKEVFIQETNNDDTAMQQAYTCVKIETTLNNYKTTLGGDNSTRVIKVDLANGVSANAIDKVRVSWYSKTDGSVYEFSNVSDDGNVSFPSMNNKVATPPTIAVGLVQTNGSFELSEFDKTVSSNDDYRTNRGMVFLVPTESKSADSNKDNHAVAWNGSNNIITREQVVKSNDRTVKNVPFEVYCDPENGTEFACSVDISLPGVIENNGGGRNDDTFMFVINVPYGQPSTDVQLELFCDNGVSCGMMSSPGDGDGEIDGNTAGLAQLQNVQVKIDSTGRANNLYRRVEARMDTADTYFPYPLYALELLGSDGDDLKKDMTVTCEYKKWSDFWEPTCN